MYIPKAALIHIPVFCKKYIEYKLIMFFPFYFVGFEKSEV